MSNTSLLYTSTANSYLESNYDSSLSYSGISNSDSESDDDYEVYSLVKRGKVWDRFKPLEAERLYYDILNSDVDNLEEVVVETLNTIKTQEYLYSMMCLILDLADYQTYELPKYKTYSIKECKQILQDLLKTGPNHQQGYLFSSTTKIATAIKYRLFKYFGLLVEAICVKGKLLSTQFNDFINVLMELSESKVMSIRHTVVVISIKFMSRFVFLMETHNDANKILVNYFNTLFPIFYKNSILKCKSLSQMKMQCIAESQIWLEKSINFSKKSIYNIKISIIDSHANVRLTALKVMYNVMEVNHLNYFFKENISNIMNYVESRLIDVQYKVRKEAINVCARALTMYNHFISASNRKILMNMILDKRISIAVAGSNYYISYLIKKYDENFPDVINALLNYIEININYLPAIVEATLPIFDLFQNFETLFELLYGDVISKQNIFVCVILQCAQQLVTNKSCIPRSGSRPVHLDTSKVLTICSFVLSNIPTILNKFHYDSNCVKDIEKFLLILDQNTLALRSLTNKMDTILIQLRDIYINTEDTSGIESLSNVLFKENDQSQLNLRRNLDLQNVIIEKYKIAYQNFNSNTSIEEVVHINNIYTKFLFVLKKIDLHVCVNYNVLIRHFNDILNITPPNFIKTVYAISNCYLNWRLKSFRQNELNESNMNQDLEECYLKLINICADMLKSTCSQYIKLLTCNCLFEMFINYKRERKIFEASTSTSNYLNLILNESLQDLLYECLKRNLFINKIGTIKERKEILRNYFHVLLNAQISYVYLTKTFSYYEHIEDYNEVFKATFNILKLKNRLFIVCDTIKLVYNDTLKTLKPQERSQEYNNVMKLSEQLIKLLKPTEYRILIENIANYTQQYKEYKLLDCFSVAAINLPADDCLPLISYLLNLFDNDTHNVNVNKFISIINRRNETMPAKKRRKR